MKKVTVVILFFLVNFYAHTQATLKSQVLKDLDRYSIEGFSAIRYESWINKQGIKKATETLLDSLQPFKMYQPGTIETLAIRLPLKTSILLDTNSNLVLNKYDSLYTSICLHLGDYLTTQHEYYLSCFYFSQCIEPYQSIYGPKSKQFLRLFAKTGY